MTILKVFSIPFWPCNKIGPSNGRAQKPNWHKRLTFLIVICFLPSVWGLIRTDVLPEEEGQVNLGGDYDKADRLILHDHDRLILHDHDRLIPHDHAYDHDNDDADLFQEIHQGFPTAYFVEDENSFGAF